jgi:hypothetical protein
VNARDGVVYQPGDETMVEERILIAPQGKLFWVFQVALWLFLFLEGLASVISGSAGWLAWGKFSVASVSLVIIGCAGVMRLWHGPARVDLGVEHLIVRTGTFSRAIDLSWSEISKIKFKTNGVELHRGTWGKVINLSLSSYVTARAVKDRLGEQGREKQIEIEGY